MNEWMDEVLRQAKGDSRARESLGGQEELPCTSTPALDKGISRSCPSKGLMLPRKIPLPKGTGGTLDIHPQHTLVPTLTHPPSAWTCLAAA